MGALVASAVTIYAWVVKFLLIEQSNLEAQAFAASPWVFVLYALSVCSTLVTGPAAIKASITAQKPPGNIFCLACLLSAWSGVLLTHTIGSNGLGGVTLQFYWWGLAIVWTFLIGGIYVYSAQGRWLAMRDWTVYAYALAWLPAIIFISYPAWRLGMEMTPDEAVVTAALMPFAGLFVLAHWYIVDVIDDKN